MRMPVLIVIGVTLIGLAGYFAWQLRTPPVQRVILATTHTVRLHIWAQQISRETGLHGQPVDVDPALYSSEEVLRRVNAHRADWGLLPGGAVVKGLENVRQVAALDLAILHLLVKKELIADVSQHFTALKGKRINLNAKGSEAMLLAEDTLRFAKVDPSKTDGAGEFVAVYVGDEEMVEQLARIAQQPEEARAVMIQRLPDAIFTLSPLPSTLAKQLVMVAGYRLVSLPFSQAFTVNRLTRMENGPDGAQPGQVNVTTIPPFLYDTDPPVPAARCETIATRVLLVVHKDTDPHALRRLLEGLHEPPLVGSLKPVNLEEVTPEFDHHVAAVEHAKRNRPVVNTQVLAHLGSALGGLGAFIGGVVAFYGFLRILQTRKFEQYYQEIRKIDLIANGVDADPNLPAAPAELHRHLEARLIDLKCRAVGQFADGGLKAEGLLQGIIALINDTRKSLDRLSTQDKVT
jgi:hypothetical protein